MPPIPPPIIVHWKFKLGYSLSLIWLLKLRVRSLGTELALEKGMSGVLKGVESGLEQIVSEDCFGDEEPSRAGERSP